MSISSSSSASSSRRERGSEGGADEREPQDPADEQENQRAQSPQLPPKKPSSHSSRQQKRSNENSKRKPLPRPSTSSEEEDLTELVILDQDDEDDDIDSTAGANNNTSNQSPKKEGYQAVNWTPPVPANDSLANPQLRRLSGHGQGAYHQERHVSKEALHAVQSAASAAKQFDDYFGSIKNGVREEMTPLYDAQEILTPREPLRQCGYYTEYALSAVRLLGENSQFGDLQPLPNGIPSSTTEKQQWARQRFMERSIDGHYCVKYLQAGLIEATDHGGTAAADMIFETRILMNLTPQHPNIAPVHGVNSGGIDTFLETSSPKDGFFFISDRIVETLTERLELWRGLSKKGINGRRGSNASRDSGIGSERSRGTGTGVTRKARFAERLDVAFDISSALSFLHDRKLVYHIRPDKVGFDAKHGVVKLCNFSQSRFDGMLEHQSKSITKSDDMATLRYTAPEVLCKSPGTTSCDVFGFGILLWELMSLRYPFEGYDRARHFEQVVQHHKRPPMNKKWDSDTRALLRGCWDPHLRLSVRKANETLEHIILKVTEERNEHHLKRLAQAQAASSNGDAHIPRRNSTGGAQGIEQLKQKQKRRSSALQHPTNNKTPPPEKPQRPKSPNGSERPPATIILTDSQDDSDGSSSPKGSSRSETRSSEQHMFHTNNSTNSNISNIRAPHKSPRRSSLGHVSARVQRQPLYHRKASPILDDHGSPGSKNGRNHSERSSPRQKQDASSSSRASRHKVKSAHAGSGHGASLTAVPNLDPTDQHPGEAPKESDSMLDYVKAKRRASVS